MKDCKKAEVFSQRENPRQKAVNVNNRIHLLFGEEYGIHVYSMPEIGTDVKIRIPVIYSDRNLIHMEERQENYC